MRRLVLISSVIFLFPACTKTQQEAAPTGPTAPQIYEDAIVKTSYDSSRPHAKSDANEVKQARAAFDAACDKNDAAEAKAAADKLLDIQRKILGDRATDVSGTIAKLAETCVRANQPKDALDAVNKQLETLGKFTDIQADSAHGAYHLLVARFKAANALGDADVASESQKEAAELRTKFGAADCCEDISAQ
jgi:hypothetical protein